MDATSVVVSHREAASCEALLRTTETTRDKKLKVRDNTRLRELFESDGT